MTPADETPPLPRRILLATDLGARSDRALDRAVALATAWAAELVVVHALEPDAVAAVNGAEQDLPSWRREPAPLEIASDCLHRDLQGVALPVTPIVAEGEPADVILDTAAARGCGLIVIAVAQAEALGNFRLGATVDKVLRRTTVPVLVVRERARHAYQSIVVAADTSPASRAALVETAALFPDTPFRVFHAYQPPLGGMLSDPSSYRAAYGQMAATDMAAFVKDAGVAPEHVLDLLVERGDPQHLMQEYVRSFDADLVVLGTQGKGAILELLVGSTARSMLASLDCDALVVPEAILAKLTAKAAHPE